MTALQLHPHTTPIRRRLPVAWLALLLLLGGLPATATATTRAKHRAVVRKALLRSVKHNPRVVLRPSFLRKAALSNLDLPVTLRLNPATNSTPTFAASDDQVQLDF